jgi:G3E family GTPase
MNRTNKITATIITGFLGAGKTTFINQLLTNNPETQFALVENEFGDVSIDTKLIKGVDASQMFELKQGCICCTISDEFELVLQELAERFPNVEHLLIETTGVADPAQVIRPFFADRNLKEIYQYNGTICLVDAINFENSPEKEITIKQLVVADLVLISKSETLSKTQKETLKETLQKINPLANIQFTQSKDFDFLAPFRAGVIDIYEQKSLIQKAKSEYNFASFSNPHSNLSTKTLQFNRPLNKQEFIDWLTYTLDVYKNQIYRAKGILCFENEPYEHILQGVGGSFEITEGEGLRESDFSNIIVIGKNIPEVKFDGCAQF